jgi:hypothetical protein
VREVLLQLGNLKRDPKDRPKEARQGRRGRGPTVLAPRKPIVVPLRQQVFKPYRGNVAQNSDTRKRSRPDPRLGIAPLGA